MANDAEAAGGRNGDTTPAVLFGDGRAYATGWVKNVEESRAVARAMGAIPLSQAAPQLLDDPKAAGDSPVFFWESEKKVLGRVLPSWNQGQVGSCVGFGYGRAVQDLVLNEVAAGEPEQWPGTEQAPEVIYGGSRVEVGGGRINGDGSIGAWAAKWVKDWGAVPRGVYGSLDITRYNETTCRQLGRNGIPSDVESLARQHPVTDVALLQTADELWAALGAGKPVPVCSMQGFTTTRDADGFCRRSGQWAHCMEYRGRFVHPRRGKSVIEQNSWGGYLGGPSVVQYVKDDGGIGTFELPEGCFCVELSVAAQALVEDDTFALAGLKGWDVTPPPGPTPPIPPVPPVPPTPPVPPVSKTYKFVGEGRLFGIAIPVTGTATPAAAGDPVGLPDFGKLLRIARLVMTAYMQFQAGDFAGLADTIQKILAELGVMKTRAECEELVAAIRG